VRIIAGEWRGHRLKSLRGRKVRPTSDRVREAWMSALGGALSSARVLDLYAGSGALGLEALSRGASEVVFVERARSALAVLEANIELLDAAARTTIVKADVRRYVKGLDVGAFDLALADPPYDRGDAAWLLRCFQDRPFANEIWVEHRSAEPLGELRGARQRRYGDTTLTTLEAA
jgi:16S rRNA (guanine966-N2)-methyltransferase